LRAFQGRTEQSYFVTRSGNAQVRILARFDPATGTLTRVPLPAGYPLAWDVDPTGRHMVVFDESGAVHVVNMETVTVEGTMSGVTAAYTSTERSRAPHLAVAEGLAYMTSPKTGEVLVIDYRARTVTGRVAVGGVPGRLALLGPDRDVMMEAH
jgi:DNA-binding beta-propeller fold protein YncE